MRAGAKEAGKGTSGAKRKAGEDAAGKVVAAEASAKNAAPAKGSGGGGGKKRATAAANGPWFTEEERVQFRRELLSWYDGNHRVLPWRRTPHTQRGAAADGEGGEDGVGPAPAELPPQQFAYWVWVSEVMLQQTQVATVIPYFRRWVSRWPTVSDLAAADTEAVNSMWAGLGYYRRARYLLEGAKFVAGQLGGTFPTSAQELLKIPGVGPYTSAAVASIAFGSPAAAVDGNVIRVLSRLRALPGDPTKLGAAHTAMAGEVLDGGRPGCYNQALMELGATVCRPVNPDCSACPARPVCRAAAEWTAYVEGGGDEGAEDAPRVTRFPGRKAVKEKREQAVAVTVLEVICSKQPQLQQQQQGQQAEGSGAGDKTPGGGGGTTAAASTQPKKRQRTMQDFALAAAARKQQEKQEAAGGGAAAAAGSGSKSDVDVSALLAKGERRYLLVMRPEGGLLAGLWEFPGAEVQDYTPNAGGADNENEGEDDDAEAGAKAGAPVPPSAAERQRASDALLRRLLLPGVALPPPTQPTADAAAAAGGSAAGAAAPAALLRVLGRHDMGTYVHVFSHIRQTNHVTRLTAVFDGELADLERLSGAAAAASGASAGGGGGSKDGAKEEEEAGRAKDGKQAEKEQEEEAGPRRFSGRRMSEGAGKEGEDAATVVSDSNDDEGEDVADGEHVDGDKEAKKAGGKKGAAVAAATTGSKRGAKGKAAAAAAATAAAAEPQAKMWVTRAQLEGPGLALSSGVKKIFELAVGGAVGAGGGSKGGAGAKGGKAAAGKEKGESAGVKSAAKGKAKAK
ncbi:hypothetical protein CHLRE_02g082000v5 [Chlamydomonas reinhardtii]|uniref:Adenine DNA glycosylase n=1 Tax=Chlamydomonas reinhardtii TaxID=3055 RepID=A8I815_CHLRE|nr:uncharacterized protein CHLRE_02g082000v5 [Chlamydomonas reinhardtii]PNW86324.1 hypothetical protein CHLRE_02g082000v5 [Chlamydomonas reinhardtii]|eukprot:XP_001701896.1 DNA repair glycosylase [Chlamydomonas reinhardtii]